ncbi:uncharacterized protein LOC116160237 isoform X1 [Photinus pyralis]|uniref:uncharacterized protein LOC116160237 isoform X1 n=1 Tax=Photinus pyralis TaxID=7054 RepID=UPI0012674816|nr:uncharacterized protein LOC116160237 isoform X1 [Photinus pyralis]
MPPKKATPEQYKLLVDMFAESKCLRWGKGTPGEKKEAWEAISAAVNTLGVEKSSDGWKKAFIEMKSHIKSKIRASNQLNPTENRCAEVTGLFISCSGISGVQEMGMPPVVDAIDTQEPEEGPQDESVEINPPDGNELLMNPNACEVVEEEFEEVETASKKKRKTTQAIKKTKTTPQQYEMKKYKYDNEENAFKALCEELNGKKKLQRSVENWKRVYT